MANNFVSIDYYRNKFYLAEINFNKFSGLSVDQLSMLSKKVYRMQESLKDEPTYRFRRISKLERYQNTLQYLTSPNIRLDLRTFDERMAYLIMMIDPNLVTFKEFLKIDFISIAEIAKVEDEKERNHLYQIRNQKMAMYKTTVREKIGLFDFKLLRYEEMFFKRFFNEKELITEVGNNNQDKFMAKSKLLKDFNSISDKRYEELVSIAQTWFSFVSGKHNLKVATYSVIEQRKLLGITTFAEQLALFILLIDSNLDMLRIYEEESTIKNIEERITEEFGYFNKELLVLERKFHDRFCPDKKISIWSKTKNVKK